MEHRYDFGGNKGLIIKIDPYGLIQWHSRYCLDRRSKDDER